MLSIWCIDCVWRIKYMVFWVLCIVYMVYRLGSEYCVLSIWCVDCVWRIEYMVFWVLCVEYTGEVGGWGRDPKICTGRHWGMGSSTI